MTKVANILTIYGRGLISYLGKYKYTTWGGSGLTHKYWTSLKKPIHGPTLLLIFSSHLCKHPC
jgi:hypothetical protein